VTVDPPVEYVDRGTDRLALHIHPEPDGVTGAPIVVVIPAMGVPARYYRPFAATLRTNGLAVVVADLRGAGASTPRPSRTSTYGYADLVSDVGAVLAALKPRLDGRRVILLGHSLGGQTSLLHTALAEDPVIDRLVLVAVGLPYWRTYPGPRRFQILPLTQGIVAVTALLRVWPGWGFGGRQARGVIRDWGFTARTGRLPVIDGVDPAPALTAIRTPVLAVSVEGDPLTPGETLDRLCALLPATLVRREHYTAAQAGGDMNHFTWVRASAPLAAQIAEFATSD
jgi:predicted alpha/beta hydrolase